MQINIHLIKSMWQHNIMKIILTYNSYSVYYATTVKDKKAKSQLGPIVKNALIVHLFLHQN